MKISYLKVTFPWNKLLSRPNNVILRQSRESKFQNFPLGANHGGASDRYYGPYDWQRQRQRQREMSREHCRRASSYKSLRCRTSSKNGRIINGIVKWSRTLGTIQKVRWLGLGGDQLKANTLYKNSVLFCPI